MTRPVRSDEPETVFAVSRARLMRSVDGGATWTRLANGLDHRTVPYALATGPADPDVGYLAFRGGGLYRSDDGGDSWAPVPGRDDMASMNLVDVAVSPFDASQVAVIGEPRDPLLLVSGDDVRGRGLFRSVDSGATFKPVAPDLLAQQVVFNSFYHPTTEPIVFSPDFAQDRTVFGLAEDRIYRSTDGGDSWVTIEIAATLHDPDDDPDAALLSAPRPPGVPDATSTDGPDRRIETPIGTLTPIRIAFSAMLALAVVVLLSIKLPAPLNRSRDRLSPNWLVTVGVALVVFVGAAAILVR